MRAPAYSFCARAGGFLRAESPDVPERVYGVGMQNASFFAAVLLVVASPLSFAAGQTWTGVITDTMCAHSHASNIEHAHENSGRTMTEQECTVGCVTKRGQKYVLVSDGKVYQIENQNYAGLPVHAAQAVKVTGSLKGDSITVSQIVVAEPAGK
jgi:hypothetical protein